MRVRTAAVWLGLVAIGCGEARRKGEDTDFADADDVGDTQAPADTSDSGVDSGVDPGQVEPPCAPADAEPNDALEEAAPIPVAGDRGEVEGEVTGVEYAGDIDAWSVVVPAGCSAQVALGPDDAGADLDLFVFSPEGTRIGEAVGAAPSLTLPNPGVADQPVVLSVQPWDAVCATYTLSVDLVCDPVDTDATCVDVDPEPNDVIATAIDATPPDTLGTPARFEGTVGGVAYAGDRDLYRVDMPAGCALAARLDFDERVQDLDLVVFDSTGAQRFVASGPEGDAELDATAAAAATWYVSVEAWDAVCADYALSLAVDCAADTDPVVDTDLCDLLDTDGAVPEQARERLTPPDTAGTADVVTGVVVGEASAAHAYDVIVPAGCTLDLSLDFDEPMRLDLATRFGEPLSTAGSAGAPARIAYTHTGGGAVDLVASVVPLGATCGGYTLEAAITCPSNPPAPACPPDAQEPNDRIDDATPLAVVADGPTVEVSGTVDGRGGVGDADLYAFELPTACEVSARITSPTLGPAFDLDLVDSTGRSLFTTDGVVLAPLLSVRSEIGETVDAVVRVVPTAADCAPYTLAVTVACPDDTFLPAPVDHPTLGQTRYLRPATYLRGCEPGRDDGAEPCGEENTPAHYATLTRGLWVMETEVTRAMYRAVTGTNPSVFSGCTDDCALDNPTFEEAQAFADQVSTADGLTPCTSAAADPYACVGWRLPTEAEWEYLARGGEAFEFAGAAVATEVGWITPNGPGRPNPPCLLPRNGFGLCDMTGNVWEWAWDDGSVPFGSDAPVVDPLLRDPGTAVRTRRGGSWQASAGRSRIAFRVGYVGTLSRNNIGFRLVRTDPTF